MYFRVVLQTGQLVSEIPLLVSAIHCFELWPLCDIVFSVSVSLLERTTDHVVPMFKYENKYIDWLSEWVIK